MNLPASEKNKAATRGELYKLVEGLSEIVLEQHRRLAALEKSPDSTVYRGVWKPGKLFLRGEFATHGGSLWHAEKMTDTRPGSGPDWKLAVKKGSIK